MDGERDLVPELQEPAVATLERAAADLSLMFALTGDANDWALSVECEEFLTALRLRRRKLPTVARRASSE